MCRALSALSVWMFALSALAHAPETRAVALTTDGSALAVALPGFGLVLRAQPEQPFVYACNALLGMKPTAAVPALAFLDDGTLLVGSADGLRRLGVDGCPQAASHELSNAPIVALALAPSARSIAYAVVAGERAGVWRSDDGGHYWELRAPLETASAVSALVVSSADPERVLLSETSAQGSVVRASSDGGRSFSAYPQPFELTLLYAQSGATERLWAMARDALTVGNRGRAILRTDKLEEPWQTPVRVAYFGGFVVDARGAISVGDELGGVMRSDDAGETFRKLPGEVPVACLAQAGEALWACTPGTLDQPAVQRMGAGEPFARVLALPEVTRLASCTPTLEIDRVCAAAWIEWQRDVLRMPSPGADAGAPIMLEDAGAADAALPEVDAELAPAEEEPTTPPATPLDPVTPRTPSCTVMEGRARPPAPLALLLALGCLLAARPRTRR